MSTDQSPEVLEQTQLAIIGRVTLGRSGPGQIESRVSDAEAASLFEEAHSRQVPVDVKKSACCIDGRCAACLASKATSFRESAESLSQLIVPERVPVRAHVPGGTYHFATIMALLANIPLVQDDSIKTFADAKKAVGNYLEANGYSDAAHTTDTKLWSPEATGCGAMDALVAGFQAAGTEIQRFTDSGISGPIGETMAILYGYDTPAAFIKDGIFKDIAQQLAAINGGDLLAAYNSTVFRDALRDNQPENLEVLTGQHVEQAVAIYEAEDFTIDRDNMNGRLFIYDRWFTEKLAQTLHGSELEQRRLKMAGDFATIFITDQLVAPGMPVGLFSKAA